MANGSLENSNGTNGSGGWDHADGLGWQLWRRASSLTLSAPGLQRYLARSRRNFAKNPVPLLSIIQRRWAASGYSFAGFAGDLPFFWGYYPAHQTSTRSQGSQLWPGSSSRATTSSLRAPAAPGLARLSRAPTEPSASEPGTHATGIQPALIAPQKGDGAKALSGSLPSPEVLPESVEEGHPSEVASRVVFETHVAGAGAPARVPMIARRPAPLSHGAISPLSGPTAGGEPLAAVTRAASYKTARQESDLRSTIAHPSPPLIAPARMVGAPPASQSSTVSTASSTDNQGNRPEVTDSPSTPPGGASEQVIVSRSVAAEPRPRATTIGDGLPVVKSEVAASSIEKEPPAPEFAPASARAAIIRSEMTGAAPERPVVLSTFTGGGGPTGVLRWAAFNPVSQPGANAIGPRIFASVSGTTITRTPLSVFRSVPRNLQRMEDSMPTGMRRSVEGRSPVVPASSGTAIPPVVPSVSVQTPRPDGETEAALGVTSKIEALALARFPQAPVAEKLGNLSPQGTLPINVYSAENQTLIHRQTAARSHPQSMDSPAARPSTGEVSNQQPEAHGAPPVERASGFAEGHVGTILARRSAPVISRWSAMPLSIGPVSAGGNRYFGESRSSGGDVPRVLVEQIGTSAPRVSRVVAEGLSGVSSGGPASEAGKEVAVSSAEVSHPAQSEIVSANDHGNFPLLSRTNSESSHGSSGSTGSVATVSSVRADSHYNGLADAYSRLGFDTRIFRRLASVAEFGGSWAQPAATGWRSNHPVWHRNHGSAPGIALRRSLPLINTGLLSRRVSQASELRRFDAARTPGPLSVSRALAVLTQGGEPLARPTSPPQGAPFVDGFRTEMSQSATSETPLVYPSPAAGLTSALLSVRSPEIGSPSLLRRFVQSLSAEGHIGSAGTKETSDAMPLALRSVAAGQPALSFVQPEAVPALRSLPQETASPANPALPIGGGGEPSSKPGESPAAGAQPKIDLDEIVEKAWQKLMRKLTVERERRGYTRWTQRN